MEPKEPQQRKLTRKQQLKLKRENRKPITGRVQKLGFDIPAGYVGRWFNDQGPRIQQALAAGYEFIDSKSKNVIASENYDNETVVRQRVDRKQSGEPLYAYLMVLEKELYDEDQAKKLESVIETENQIVTGKHPKDKDKIDGELVYVKSADLRGQPM